ncbi:uncharacterized protein METZ01_LOCUS266636, partial [marine metagenome]
RNSPTSSSAQSSPTRWASRVRWLSTRNS